MLIGSRILERLKIDLSNIHEKKNKIFIFELIIILSSFTYLLTLAVFNRYGLLFLLSVLLSSFILFALLIVTLGLVQKISPSISSLTSFIHAAFLVSLSFSGFILVGILSLFAINLPEVISTVLVGIMFFGNLPGFLTYFGFEGFFSQQGDFFASMLVSIPFVSTYFYFLLFLLINIMWSKLKNRKS